MSNSTPEEFAIVIVGAYSGGLEVLELLLAAKFEGRVALVRDFGAGRDVGVDQASRTNKMKARAIKRAGRKLNLTIFNEAMVHPADDMAGLVNLEGGSVLKFEKLLMFDPLDSRSDYTRH